MDSDNLPRRSARNRKINSDKVVSSKNSKKRNVHAYRCRPHLIPPLMKLLSDKQKGFVRKIGFESFLSMSDFQMNKTLTLWLVDKFNCDTEALEFEGGISIPVRPLVKCILGIPSGPIQVIRVSDLDNCHYRKYSSNNNAKDANTVAREMCSITEEEPFCIAFMMVILGMYLAPNTTLRVDRSFLGAIQQVGNLKHMDWCNFVANYLFKGIREFKESNSSFARIKGCVHILSVIFIDLVKQSALEVPKGFPRLGIITTEHNKWVASQPFASLMVCPIDESVYASVLVKILKDNIINGEQCASSDTNTAVGADQFDISEKDTTCNSAGSMQSHSCLPATRSDEEVPYISVSVEPPEDSDRHGRSTPTVNNGTILNVNRESSLNSTKCVGLSSNSSNFHHGDLDDNSQKNLFVVNPITAKVSPAFNEPEIPYVAKINDQLYQCHDRSSSPTFDPTVVSNANELNASDGFFAKEKSQCLEVESQQNLEIAYPNAKNDALVSKKIYSVSADFGTAKPLPNAISLSVIEPVEKDTLAQSAAHEDAHTRQGSAIIVANSDNIPHQSVEQKHIIFPRDVHQVCRCSSLSTEGMQVAPDAATGRNKVSPSTMEKGDRATKKARVEQPGSSAVVDTSLLNCPICSRPFKPPVFQCKGGHLACGSCLTKLPDNQCRSCKYGGAFDVHNKLIDAIVSSTKIRCPHDGCGSYVPYHKLDDHKYVCPHAPCLCTEPGCSFVGSPQELLRHLTTVHSWPVHNIEYGKVLRLQVPVSEQQHLLLAEEDDCVFLLVVGVLGLTVATAVSVVCLRANTALRPGYMLEILANLPPAAANSKAHKLRLDMEVESSTRPGEVAVEEQASFLTVPPRYLVEAGASKVVPLEIRIDKIKS